MKSISTEKELHRSLELYFAKWFDVYTEVRSDCGNYRIDLVLIHHTDKEQQSPIGIELKKSDIKRGTDISDWCKQAETYTKTTFFNKRIPVFTAPQITGWYLREGKLMFQHPEDEQGCLSCQNNVNSFLHKSFGIGELQKFVSKWPKHKWEYRLVINTKQIWAGNKPLDFNFHRL